MIGDPHRIRSYELWHLKTLGTLRYGDYGLRTTVGRKISCCAVLGRVHNQWHENTKLIPTPDYERVLAVKNTAACLCFCYFASKLSFVKVQNAQVYSLADEIIDEEVFVLLFVNPQIQHIHAGSTKLFVSTRLIQVNIWQSLGWARKIFLVWPRYSEWNA